MRILVATLMASAASFIAISSASAADAVDQIPAAPMAVEEVAPAATWQGFYLGATGSYDWGRFGGGDYNAKGAGGGAYTGYNWQSGQVVYGIEADVGYNGQDGRTSGGYRGEAGWDGSVRGRVGYDLNPFLIYGTAGVALQNNELKDATSSDDKTSVGYTVGACYQTHLQPISLHSWRCTWLYVGQHQLRRRDKDLRNVAPLGECYSLGCNTFSCD